MAGLLCLLASFVFAVLPGPVRSGRLVAAPAAHIAPAGVVAPVELVRVAAGPLVKRYLHDVRHPLRGPVPVLPVVSLVVLPLLLLVAVLAARFSLVTAGSFVAWRGRAPPLPS